MSEQTFSAVYIFPVNNKENCCPQDSKEGHFANHPKGFLASHLQALPAFRAVWEGKDTGEGGYEGRQCSGGWKDA